MLRISATDNRQSFLINFSVMVFCTFFLLPNDFLYAQEKERNTDIQVRIETGTRDKGVSSKSKIDPSVRDLYREYQRWVMEYVAPLEDTARKAGFDAPEEDITQRTRVYARLFPGIQIPLYLLRSEIVVQKYLENSYGQNYSNDDLKNAYRTAFSPSPQGIVPSIEELNPHLKLRVLLSKPDQMSLLVRIKEERERSQLANLRKAMEAWTAVDLKIDAPDNECVATSLDSSTCAMTVKEYNSKVRYQNIPKSYPIDSARFIAVKNMLTDLYIIKQAEDSGFAKSDSAQIQKQIYIDFERNQTRFFGLGRRITDEYSMHRVYNEFYDLLFSKRTIDYFSVLGSSDSSYIDSILKLAIADTSFNDSKVNDSIIKMVPWRHLLKKELPVELLRCSDTLRKGQIGVVKTRYGFFIVRNDSSFVRPSLQLQDVREVLIYIATKQKWLNMDSICQEKAFAIYKNNKSFSFSPDTFDLTIRFYPDSIFCIDTVCERFDSLKTKTIEKAKGTLKVPSSVLPYEIQDKLMELYGRVHDSKKMTGLLQTKLGLWEIRTYSRKRGGLAVPFKYVKQYIIDSLVMAEIDSVFNQNQHIDSAYDQMALARVYMPHYLGIDGKMGDRLSRELKNQSLRENGASTQVNIKDLIKKYTEKQMGKINEWFSHIEINWRLLHLPDATTVENMRIND